MSWFSRAFNFYREKGKRGFMNIQYETGKLREPILNVSTEVALNDTAQKIKFSTKDFFSKCDQPADFVSITGEILNGKLHFLCSVNEKAQRFI